MHATLARLAGSPVWYMKNEIVREDRDVYMPMLIGIDVQCAYFEGICYGTTREIDTDHPCKC